METLLSEIHSQLLIIDIICGILAVAIVLIAYLNVIEALSSVIESV
jgi:hypothetical protein